MPNEKHTVHLREGGKVVIDGDRVELHLDGPLVFGRKRWTRYLTPQEEASRSFSYGGQESALKERLAEAFRAVPMIVHEDPSDD